jgi:formylglycine-generating enzyme required for sulfatase activity
MPSATGSSGSKGAGGGERGAAGPDKALDDAVGMRRAGRGLLSLALLDSRNHLLSRLAMDDGPEALRLAARAGWYQEYWLSRHVQRSRGETCDPAGLRLAGIEPAADGWLQPDGPLPTPETVRAYLADTLELTLDLLAAPGEAAEDDAALHFYRCSLLHEDRLGETLAQRLRPGAPAARPARSALWLPAQRWMLGSVPGGFVPHPERWAHEVAVPEFEIDAQAVDWAAYLEFASDGGYDRPEFWSEAGWNWLQRDGRRAPGQVEQMHDGVLVARGHGASAGLRRVALHQPVMHVSRHEAEAWCRWAGRRLPTEPEWELAASQGAGRGFVWGEVWEWVAGSARLWPGAGKPAPGSPDAAPAEGQGVLRGASFVTRGRWRLPKARRFAAVEDDTLFCGFRSCAL